MMIRRKITVLTVIVIIFLTILPVGSSQSNDIGRYKIELLEGWAIIKTDTLNVAIPSDATIPMFIWWYNNDDSVLYVAKYEGLAEAWLFASETFNHNKLFEDAKGFKNEFIVRAHWHGWIENPSFILKINEALKNLHPFFFSFSQGKWELTPIQEIRAKDGRLVGLAFAFILVDPIDSSFEFAKGNIMIRNKLFFDPVEMQVGNDKVVLSKAELKSDIIISNWKWNYDTFRDTLGELSYDLPEIEPKLVLSAKFNIRSSDENRLADILNEERGNIISDQGNINVKVRVGDRTFVVGKVEEEDDIITINGLPKLEMLTEKGTIVSFFSFTPTATIVYQSDTKSVDVKGVYWATRSLKAFLIYPYFGKGTLLHDPSIGITSPELEGETPKYIFIPPITSKDIVPPPQSIIPIEIVPSFELAMGAIAFVIIVAAVIVITKKTKIEVLNGI